MSLALLPSCRAPSIRLTAAIDYLDVVWRLACGKRLFDLRSAERVASLETEVAPQDELESRLSVLADLLRTAAKELEKGGERKERDRILRPLSSALTKRIDDAALPRVLAAVDTLEAIATMPDSRQHGGAAHRLVDAARTLGLAYPIVDWPTAWQILYARVVEAFGVIRDELRATLD